MRSKAGDKLLVLGTLALSQNQNERLEEKQKITACLVYPTTTDVLKIFVYTSTTRFRRSSSSGRAILILEKPLKRIESDGMIKNTRNRVVSLACFPKHNFIRDSLVNLFGPFIVFVPASKHIGREETRNVFCYLEV